MNFSFLEIIGIILIIGIIIIVGIIVFYLLKLQVKTKNIQQKIATFTGKKEDTLAIKLQAYERMLLFSERINPVKMLVRIKPLSENTDDYLQLLIANIEQEFEHNLVQQIYISNDTWIAILAAKGAIINNLKQAAEVANTANNLRENVLIEYSKKLPPTETAISFIKNEVRKLL